MKNTAILTIVSAILFLLIAAGCRRSDAWSQLDEVERLMDHAPDSALTLVCTIDTNHLAKGEEWARYALLKSMALDKNYIDLTDDSLICVAVRHYEASNDAISRMLSHFYHGRIKMNAHNYPQGVLLISKSLEEARELNDYFWMGKSAEAISDMYSLTYHRRDELAYARLQLDYYKKAGNKRFTDYAICALARAYNNNQMLDSSIYLSKAAIDTAKVRGDSILSLAAKRYLGLAYFNGQQYDKAIAVYEDNMKDDDMGSLCNLALSYIYTGDMESASRIKSEVESREAHINKLFFLYKYAKYYGDNEQALHYLEKLTFTNDSILNASLNENFNTALAENHRYETTVKDIKMKNTRDLAILIITLLSLVLIGIVYLSVKIYKRQVSNVEKNIAIAQNLEDILSVRETEYVQARDIIQTLLSNRYQEIDNLCKLYYENQSAKNLTKRISQSVESLIMDLSSNNDKIQELEDFVNANYSDVMSSFRSDYPNLKGADYLLFLYTILGFSISTITLFLKEEKIESVYNRKARLKTRIKKSDSPRKDTYLDMLQ